MTSRDHRVGPELRYDRGIVIGLLGLVTSIGWAYTVHQARVMTATDAAMWRDMDMSMNGMEPSWTAIDILLVFLMWAAMMAAMMVPGAGPMMTAFAIINRRRRERAAPYVSTSVFLAGYLAVWSGFSVAAVALQWALQKTGLLTTMMESSSNLVFFRAVSGGRSLSI